MNFNRDYFIELIVGSDEWHKSITADDISHVNVVDNFVYFFRGLNVILAVPVNNIAFYGSKDRVRESTK